MTTELPWTSVGVATCYRGKPLVSTASATAHDTSTANATIVATARAAVLSVANSVVLTMETYGSPWQFPRLSTAIRPLPRQRGNHHGFPRQLLGQFPRTSNRSNFHRHPRPSAAIATEVRGYCHSTRRALVGGKLRRTNHAHGGPWQLLRQFPWKPPWHESLG